MSVETTIVCDGCSTIIVVASAAGIARREGRRDKNLFRINLKDLCAKCYQRYKAAVDRIESQPATQTTA